MCYISMLHNVVLQAELKLFLDKKVREQHLIVSGGEYQLPK